MIVCFSNLTILAWFFVSIIYETKDIFSIGEPDKILVSLCFEYVMALLGFVGYKGINEEYANSWEADIYMSINIDAQIYRYTEI